MSHIRIEFLRPHDMFQDQATLEGIKIPVTGETWVFGICGHNDNSDDLTFYYFRGRLETVPLGEVKKGVVTLFSDPDIAEAVNAAPEGVYDVGKEVWRSFVTDHIATRQLQLLEQFHNKGGGDHNAPLFPVFAKSGERYDEAFFYQHIVPHLVSGIHQTGQGEINNGSETGEESLEETLINGSWKLLKAKQELEKTRANLDETKGIFDDLKRLDELVGDIKEAEEKFHSSLRKVHEVGAALRTISEAGLPGLPKMVPHSDPKVNALLNHMAIKPGSGVYLRVPGMDGLMGWKWETSKLISKMQSASCKIS